MKPRVIIVDDDRETRELLALTLVQAGFDVTPVANGLRLISVLHVDHPDLILMDVNLSWIDGYELCRAVKRNEEFSGIPVVFISARSSPQDRDKGLSAGAVEFLVKPVDVGLLAGRLRAVLAASGRGSSTSGGQGG